MNKHNRRAFLRNTATSVVGGVMLSKLFHHRLDAASVVDLSSNDIGIAGVAMVTSISKEKPRVDLISLRDNRILATFENIYAEHAVVPVETLNRFFVHGSDTKTGKGLIWGLEVDLQTEDWKVIYEKQLEGGLVRHWQPNSDYSLIQYNTIIDRALHVLDTKTLELQTYPGGGTHSNMAFFNDDAWLVATDYLRNGTKLRVIDRSSKEILSETNVGDWGHGVTVNNPTERAFVWANDGVHMVSLNRKNLGTHLGVIKSFELRQRSWFCWTPQGGRYSHDQTWNVKDKYSPWLTAIDLEEGKLEKIETGQEQPGTLQISPDGKIGLCGSHSSNNVCLFNIETNKFLGTVGVGNRNKDFFDRDASFSRDRNLAFVTNPPDKTITVIKVRDMKVIGQIKLPSKPIWMKVLTI